MSYQIIVTRNFYEGALTYMPTQDYLRGENGEVKNFKTFENANNWIKYFMTEVYSFNNKEITRPEYTICKNYNWKEALGIPCKNHIFSKTNKKDIPPNTTIIEKTGISEDLLLKLEEQLKVVDHYNNLPTSTWRAEVDGYGMVFKTYDIAGTVSWEDISYGIYFDLVTFYKYNSEN